MNRRAAVAALMVAVPLVWANERTIEAERSRAAYELARPLVVVLVSDTARFAACKRAGGYVDMADAWPEPEKWAVTCEYRPQEGK